MSKKRKLIAIQSTAVVALSLISCELRLPDLAPSVVTGPQEFHLSWTPPTTNSDGSSLTDLAAFRLYRGEESGRYLLEEILPGVPHKTVTLLPGRHFFSVTAIDYSGNESEKSEELEIIVQ